MLELSVTVELVAKEIAEAHPARTHTCEHLRERSFVDLEQPELRTLGVQQRRSDA
jgi:hypothetical protein